MDYGFNGLYRRQNSNNLNTSGVNSKNLLNSNITISRVKSIVLDDTYPNFENIGGWNALGCITTYDNDSLILPLNPNNKHYPLIDEIVYIITGAIIIGTSDRNELVTKPGLYYMNIVGIFNNPHHNAYPFNLNSPHTPVPNPTDEVLKNYISSEVGDANIPTTQPVKIFLGKTFKEKDNIHPLLPFEGDVIQEGRWGNSIRLGSTVKGTPNNWSSAGNDGDPLIIIRNGQGQQVIDPITKKDITNDAWIPTTENINYNNSSIYLTSTQKIPLTGSSTSYISYSSSIAPDSPDTFSGRQIILNSGRLLFNAGTDHILLSSANTINLNSQESVNIDTKDFIVQSIGNIYLGSYNASEPLLKGNLTVDVLQNLIAAIKQLNDTFKNLQTQPVVSLGQPVGLDTPMKLASIKLNTTLTDIEKQLKDLTSKYNFTI